MPQGKYGLPDVADIDLTSTPAQSNHQPYADDPFSGNDNNRRAHELLLAEQAAARGEITDADVKALAEQQISEALQVVLPQDVDDAAPAAPKARTGAAAPTWKPNA